MLIDKIKIYCSTHQNISINKKLVMLLVYLVVLDYFCK